MFFIYLTLQVEFIRTADKFRLASVVCADVLRHELVGCLINGLHCDASIPKCELPGGVSRQARDVRLGCQRMTATDRNEVF